MTYLKWIEVVAFWLLSLVFFSAAVANFVEGRLVYGYFGLFAALGVLPPLKFPLIVKILALAVAGVLLFM